MKALILNSGMGSRMGLLTAKQPKCMTEISSTETILSRQLRQLVSFGIEEVVITTGAFSGELVRYCEGLDMPLKITFVKNPDYKETNYIFSIYCARKYLDDDILMLHGDLVFESEALARILESGASCMAVSRKAALPEKDFKAVVRDGRITGVGIAFFEEAVAAQPLYFLRKEDWRLWLSRITAFCEAGKTKCYAEDALNEITADCEIVPVDVDTALCAEVDDASDLARVSEKLREVENRTVYMSFSTDIIHSGHIALINKAKRLGRLIVGILSDEAVASYKRLPLLPFAERKALFSNVSGVWRVVEQRTLSYADNLKKYRPDYVVHGDDWTEGFQKPVRDEVVSVLASYGGKLVEYPYAKGEKYARIEERTRREISMPDIRRGLLRKAIGIKGLVTAIEAHSGITGLIAEKTLVYQNGGARQFDAMWISSLCDSTAKGKPDIELVDMTSRFRTIDDIMEVTTKPVIFDGDTGGLREHFIYTVRTLERMGVSMVIIEDKVGLKRNSLLGTEVAQQQDTIAHFCEKIAAGKKAQRTRDFMICARIESLILERGLPDALERAAAYTGAGADAIMIHSRRKVPDEIFAFVDAFRKTDRTTPVVVVPTSFHEVTEEVFKEHGVNIVIYANQLTRAGFPAMQEAAARILKHHRAKECDDICMPIKDIIRLIPEDSVT